MTVAHPETVRLLAMWPAALVKKIEREARGVLGLTEEVVLVTWARNPWLFGDSDVSDDALQSAGEVAATLLRDSLQADVAEVPWNVPSPAVARALKGTGFRGPDPKALLRTLMAAPDSLSGRLFDADPARVSQDTRSPPGELVVMSGRSGGEYPAFDDEGALGVRRGSATTEMARGALTLRDRTIPREREGVAPLVIRRVEDTITFDLQAGTLWLGRLGGAAGSITRIEAPSQKRLLLDAEGVDFRYGSTWLHARAPRPKPHVDLAGLRSRGRGTSANGMPPARIFISYSHKDESYREELEIHLSSLQRQGQIATWHDRRISPGTDWAALIDKNLHEASILLLLISPDFIASDYCFGRELELAMQQHAEGRARVIPVILRPTELAGTSFMNLQALPKDAKPVNNWPNHDDAWLDVERGIRRVVEELRTR